MLETTAATTAATTTTATTTAAAEASAATNHQQHFQQFQPSSLNNRLRVKKGFAKTCRVSGHLHCKGSAIMPVRRIQI